jgi:hypothetical protein
MALKFRRGTTAQQSGSLVFGEPYVNTTLGTLIIGGPTGDIILSSTGTGSTGNFGAISGSGLDITGNANIAGNLTLGGTITIGDAATDNVVVNADLSSSIIPDVTNAFDLGSTTKVYRNIYATSISGAIAATNGVVSGSSQVTLQSTTGFTAYNTALATITGSLIASASNDAVSIANLNTFSASENSKAATLATYTGSVDGRFSTLGTVTASYDGRFVTLATTTGSLQTSVTNLNVFTASQSTASLVTSITNLNTTTASLNTSVSNLNTFTASQLTQNSTLATYTGSVEGRFSTLATLTGSNSTRLTNLETTTASLNTSVSNLNTFSASENSKAATLATYTGSVDGKFTTIASVTASYDGRFTTLGTYTGSVETRLTQVGVVTGSLITSASNLTQRVGAIEAVSGTFARTNSTNTFTGNQTITGSLFVTQDLIVQGSSSIQNVSSSTLNIGTNLITVAVNQPSVRFGGFAVIDSGSAGGSGSFLYDSVQDEFIFVHRGNGTNVTSSHFVLGPETYDNLGNEIYLTNNRLPKGTGKEHLVDSNITDSGTLITLGSNTVVTGTLSASGTVLVSASAQIDHNSTTNYVANRHIDHTSVLISAGNGLSGGGDISSTRTLTLDTTSATFTTGVKSKLDADGVISGSSQLTTAFDARYLNTGGDSVVSGSSQIVFNGVTGTVSNSQLANSTISGIALGSNLANLTIGTGLSGTSYNGSTGVTIANTGVTQISVSGAGISASPSTGQVTLTNTGVTSNVAGTGVTVSGATGAVTISIGQSVATNATPTFGNLTINGTITATGDITAFFTSDIRHKNNIQLIDNALDKVNALNGVTWEWNDDVDEVTKTTPKTGLIAQDVLDVLPEVVKIRENGFLALDYSKMVGLLVEAIKEQDIVIQKLKSDMVGLSKTITVFEDRMKEKGLL